MLKIVHKDGQTYKATFSRTSDHIIRLSENPIKVNTSGFFAYRTIDDKFLGSYEDYTTVYRKENEYTEYSNDGSVYIPPKPSFESVRENKIKEMNDTQQQVIQNGVDVVLSDGTYEHFTLTDHDQTSLMGLQTMLAQGAEAIPWHTSNQAEHCKYYSNEDMTLIVTRALEWVTFHVTYFRDLRIFINSCETEEELNEIYYGIEIPLEYQSDVLKDLYEKIRIEEEIKRKELEELNKELEETKDLETNVEDKVEETKSDNIEIEE